MERDNERNNELEDNQANNSELLLEILDNRDIISEQIERSPHSSVRRSYEGLQVPHVYMSGIMRGIIPDNSLHEASFDAEFSKDPGQSLVLDTLTVNPSDSSPSVLRRNERSYILETGHGNFWTGGEELAIDCLNLSIPAPTEDLPDLSIEQYADYFANASQTHESREFHLHDDKNVFSVHSTSYDLAADTIDRLEIARLQRDGERFLGTRLVLIESLESRRSDTTGRALSSTLYVEEVAAQTAEEATYKLTSLEQLFYRENPGENALAAMDEDRKSDILDALDALDKSGSH